MAVLILALHSTTCMQSNTGYCTNRYSLALQPHACILRWPTQGVLMPKDKLIEATVSDLLIFDSMNVIIFAFFFPFYINSGG